MTFTPPTNPALGQDTLYPSQGNGPAYSILSVAKPLPVNPQMGRSPDGLPTPAIRLGNAGCVQSKMMPNCRPNGADPLESQQAEDGFPFFPVGWYVPVGCDNTPANQAMFERWRQMAEANVTAATAHMIEASLWSDGSLASQQGAATVMPAFATVAATVGSGTVNPRDGVGQIISAYNDCNFAGGQAVLHIPDILSAYLIDHRVIQPVGAKLQGPNGCDVVLGGGYDGSIGPFNNSGSLSHESAGTVWIYMTGPIYMELGKPYSLADPFGRLAAAGVMVEGYANPRLNEQSVLMARRALYAFDTCCVYGIKVDVPSVTGYVG